MIMGEKFVKGVISGVIAGIVKDIPDAIFRYGLKITEVTFWDYAGTIALGHHPLGLYEQIYAVFYEIIFSIFVAIVFVYIAPYYQTKHYLLRGAIYGALVWFAIRAAVLAFQITPLISGEIISCTINSLNSIIYGIVLGIIIHYFDQKTIREQLVN